MREIVHVNFSFQLKSLNKRCILLLFRAPPQSLRGHAAVPDEESRSLTDAELAVQLAEREAMMQQLHGQDGLCTDQWLRSGDKPLRLCLQASTGSGTGKNLLLETLFLWCHLNGHTVRAGAHTGIADARLRVPRTLIHAMTLHYLFGDRESKLNASNQEDKGTRRLASMTVHHMTVLMLDEASMIDDAIWRCL